MPETKVVGHRWSARSSEVREFLARNQVPYRWYSSEEAEGQRLLAAAGADGRALPVVVTPDGDPLVEPTDAALAARVGLATTPSKDFYDLIVIGGGPAGLGAAVYGASEGLRTVLVERLATGGQAGQSSRIENYLGFPDGVSGAQLTSRARRQAAKFGAEVLTTREVTGLEVRGSARRVVFADGSFIDAHTVILATGVSYRKLDAPGLDEAAARTGNPRVAGDALEWLAEMTRAGGTDWALRIEARSCALLSDPGAAEGYYREAIDRLGPTRRRPALARAHLLYGEWLRRQRRRRDARDQLGIAFTMFDAIGMEAFAGRARAELRATGERARPRQLGAPEVLTAHEAQIARMVAEHLFNREIAARLFISASTVAYRRRKIFRKLGVTSRVELARTLPDGKATSTWPE